MPEAAEKLQTPEQKPGDPQPERAPEVIADPPPPVEPDQTKTPMPPHPMVQPTLDPVPAPTKTQGADIQDEINSFFREQNRPVELPDGSLRVNIVVPAEMVPVIKEWATGADVPFDQYLQSHIETCLNAGTMAGHTW